MNKEIDEQVTLLTQEAKSVFSTITQFSQLSNRELHCDSYGHCSYIRNSRYKKNAALQFVVSGLRSIRRGWKYVKKNPWRTSGSLATASLTGYTVSELVTAQAERADLKLALKEVTRSNLETLEIQKGLDLWSSQSIRKRTE